MVWIGGLGNRHQTTTPNKGEADLGPPVVPFYYRLLGRVSPKIDHRKRKEKNICFGEGSLTKIYKNEKTKSRLVATYSKLPTGGPSELRQAYSLAAKKVGLGLNLLCEPEAGVSGGPRGWAVGGGGGEGGFEADSEVLPKLFHWLTA